MTPVAIGTPIFTGVRLAMQATLTAEFAAEGIVFGPRQLNAEDAVSQASGAVFPLTMNPREENVDEVTVQLGVQVYDATMTDSVYQLADAYDPSQVEQWLERACRALVAEQHAIGLWYGRVIQAGISVDPVGNPSQAELVFSGFTGNPFSAPNV